MSKENDGFPSVDNLTPFEYALAGVQIPDAQDSPSLGMIQQMRLLAAEVDDAPVVKPELVELMRTGGLRSRRTERRGTRRRRPTSTADVAAIVPEEGGFVDITPIELSEENDNALKQAAASNGNGNSDGDGDGDGIAADSTGPIPLNGTPPPPNGQAMAGNGTSPMPIIGSAMPAAPSEPAGPERNGSPSGATNEPIPTAEQNPNGSSDSASNRDSERGSERGSDGIDTSTTVTADHEPNSPELERLDHAIERAQALLAGDEEPAESDSVAEESADLNTDGSKEGASLVGLAAMAATADQAADRTADQAAEDAAETTSFDDYLTVVAEMPPSGNLFALEDGNRLSMVEGVAPAPPTPPGTSDDPRPPLFPAVPDGPALEPSAAEYPGEPLAAEAPLGSDEDANDDGAVLVGVGAAGMSGILGATGEVYIPQAEPGDPLAAFNGPSQESRRVGGALWALVGTAAAAAVLVLGGLWWAGNLGDGTELDSAAPSTSAPDQVTEQSADTAVEADQSGQEAPPPSSGGVLDVEDNSDSGDFGNEGTQEPSRSSGGANDSGSNPATSDPDAGNDTPVTTNAPASATTEAPSTETTVPRTTVAPETTELPTITSPPATQATTQPPASTRPTAPPTEELAFIGDSVNFYSFGGPGASGVRVELYADGNRDNAPDELLETTRTSNAGRYSFNVAAGCYVVRIFPPNGFRLQNGQEQQPICVGPGESRARVDAVLLDDVRESRPPDGCLVETNAGQRQGVEVYETDGDFAESYTFFDGSGSVVYRTPSEPHDTDPGGGDWEWVGEIGGFDHRAVRTVAAVRGGVTSPAITCNRQSG